MSSGFGFFFFVAWLIHRGLTKQEASSLVSSTPMPKLADAGSKHAVGNFFEPWEFLFRPPVLLEFLPFRPCNTQKQGIKNLGRSLQPIPTRLHQHTCKTNTATPTFRKKLEPLSGKTARPTKRRSGRLARNTASIKNQVANKPASRHSHRAGRTREQKKANQVGDTVLPFCKLTQAPYMSRYSNVKSPKTEAHICSFDI